MFEITRLMAKTIGIVFKKASNLRGRASLSLPVQLVSSREGLLIRAQTTGQHAVEYHVPGQRETASLIVTMQLLKDVEGTKHDTVIITPEKEDRVTARWQDVAVPKSITVDAPSDSGDRFGSFPKTATNVVPCEPNFLRALNDAMGVTEPLSSLSRRRVVVEFQHRSLAMKYASLFLLVAAPLLAADPKIGFVGDEPTKAVRAFLDGGTDKKTRTLELFKANLAEQLTEANVEMLFGKPDRKKVSSAFYLLTYEYDLADGSKVCLGFFPFLSKATHVKKDGTTEDMPLK